MSKTTKPIAEEKEPFYHAKSDSSPHVDGQFARKLDPQEQARMQAMMANLNAQASQFITKELDMSYTLPKQGGESLEGGAIDLKAIPTLYFKGCKGCQYVIDHRTVKVMIEDCQDCTFTFNNSILTSTLEAWKCKNLTMISAQQIKTMQLDLSHTVTFTLPSISLFGTIVWNSCELLTLSFTSTPQHNLTTGFAQMLPSHPDSSLITDQFILRQVEGQLLHERCIRLNNGFLSTEREAVEWDKRNELARERFVERFMKDGGITINKKKTEGPKIGPNDPCTCSSGKKYKKCCFNKKVLEGVEGEVKADLYKPASKK